MFLFHNREEIINSPKFSNKFKETVIIKAKEFVDNIENMHLFPKYLRKLIIDNISKCVHFLNAI
jgi:hypothetical protein